MSNKLNDTQFMLLNGASQRDDHHVSLPTGVKLTHARRAAARLLEAGLAREVKARKDAPVWRRDKEAGQAYSLKLTAAGLKAIAIDDGNGSEKIVPQTPGGDAIANGAAHAATDRAKRAGRIEPSHAATTPVSPRIGTKIAEVVALLAGDRGATLDQLAATMGWLPHTTRATLTGLRKRGYSCDLGSVRSRPVAQSIGSCPDIRSTRRPKRRSPLRAQWIGSLAARITRATRNSPKARVRKAA